MKKKKALLVVLILAAFVMAMTLRSCQGERGYRITQYGTPDGNQYMFYTIENNETGELVVIDGGWQENAEFVRQTIKDKGGVVTAWILTHPHPDHIGVFNVIYENPDGIVIRHIYDDDIDYEAYDEVDESWDEIEVYAKYLELTQNADNITHLKRGDTFEIIGLDCEVFNAWDEAVTDISDDYANDGSLMIKLSSEKDSFLVCGDVTSGMAQYIMDTYGDRLDSGIVQMGHHGNWGLTEEFYDMVKPHTAFFDAPQWLMTDTQSTYDAYKFKEYMEKMGAKVYDFSTAPNVIVIQ